MRAAIVTGAGSGIGRATALALAARGYAVALVGRTLTTLEAVATDIHAAGGAVEVIVADVSQPEPTAAFVAQATRALGRIDVLVNNAGYAPAIPLAKLTVEQWQAVLNTNLSAAFYATKAVWPIMERQHATDGSGGTIVNISSMAARDPFPGLGAYGAAKAALNMLTLMTAREGDPVGIRAIGIAPGAVETPMFRAFVGTQPVDPGIILPPEDIAAVVVDAVTGSLRHCSGETIFVHRRPA